MSSIPRRARTRSVFAAAVVSCASLALSSAVGAAAGTTLAARAVAATTELGLGLPVSGVVTRAQAVTAVDAVLGLAPQTAGIPAYTDVLAASPGFGAIQAALGAGLMTGWAPSSGTFQPAAPMSRIDLAILATNVLGLRTKAEAASRNATAFPRLADLWRTGFDLGFANLMLQMGIVPPETARAFSPHQSVSAPVLAVAVYRMWLLEDVPRSVTLTPASGTLPAGQTDALAWTGTNRLGAAIPAANLAKYTPSYSVAAPGETAAGAFSATAPGSYAVTVSVSGPLLASPLTATVIVRVPAPPVYPLSASSTVSLLSSSPAAAATGNVTLRMALVNTAGRPFGGLRQSDFAVTSNDTTAGTGGVLPVSGFVSDGAGVYAVTVDDTSANESGGVAQPQTLTVRVDAVTLTATPSVTVTPGPEAAPLVSTPSGATAGSPFTVTVSLVDAYGNLETGTNTTTPVGSTSGDLNVSGLIASPSGTTPTGPPSLVTWTNGVTQFAVTAVDATTQTLSADIVGVTPGAGTSTVDVAPGPPESGYVLGGTWVSSVGGLSGTYSPQTATFAAPTNESQTVTGESGVDGGDPSVFTLQAIDGYGNMVMTGGGQVSVSFAPGQMPDVFPVRTPDANYMTTPASSPGTVTVGPGGVFTVNIFVANGAMALLPDVLSVGTPGGGNLVDTISLYQ